MQKIKILSVILAIGAFGFFQFPNVAAFKGCKPHHTTTTTTAAAVGWAK